MNQMTPAASSKKKYSGLLSVLLVLAAAILWGIIGLFSRRLSDSGFNAVQITFLRCFIAALCLLLRILITGRQSFHIRLRDLPYFFGTGICSIVFFNICYFITLNKTSVSVASVLLYTAPFFVILLSAVFFHERITPRKLLALLFAFSGCLFVTGAFGSSTSLTLSAMLTGIGSGFGYGLYTIFAKPALTRYSSVTVTFYTFLFASAGILPFTNPGKIITLIFLQPSALIPAVLLGLISTLLPFLLYTKGLEKLEAGKASVIAFFEPLTATVMGIVVFHEKPNLYCLIGILLIFFGVLLLSLRHR